MVRVVFNQVASRWATMPRPRSGLAQAAMIAAGLVLGLIALGLALVLAIIAIPFALVGGAIWWVRGRLAGLKGDGRRNVRVIGVARSEG